MNRNSLAFFMTAFCLMALSVHAQSDPFVEEFLERWDGSKRYLVAMADAMPAERYDFRPSEEEMTFAEQLMHIAVTVEWHIASRFEGLNTPYRVKEYQAAGLDKEAIKAVLVREMDKAAERIRNADPARLSETNSYGELQRTGRQFLLLAADHIAHHRGQLVVYLRMNAIKPPNYILYQ
ncbi:hypothetical protein ADIS_0531 [Lunatimonas lonarensis]|uniref:DinB-like domain-containing protein n=1 Tax=Lunatimonas lonarensis TaxID=1232681 RepID=R7ZY42_9BACT|nr:DinB family protein [Lunatimonas lonarensis]EON78938.1 hypothetical protein ADIS_0531 [Lunatimonas lonarensis]